MKLKSIQKKFIDCIYRDEHSLKTCLSNEHPDLSISIYKNNAIHNLINALSIMYPSVSNLLENGAFDTISKGYIKHNPSTDGNLDVYGITFPKFLKENKAIDQYIYSMARLDLAYHFAYIAKDYCARRVEDFKNIASKDYENTI